MTPEPVAEEPPSRGGGRGRVGGRACSAGEPDRLPRRKRQPADSCRLRCAFGSKSPGGHRSPPGRPPRPSVPKSRSPVWSRRRRPRRRRRRASQLDLEASLVPACHRPDPGIRPRRVRHPAACSAGQGHCRRSPCVRGSPVCRRVQACLASGRRSVSGQAWAVRSGIAAGHDTSRAAAGTAGRGACRAGRDHAHHHSRRGHDGQGPGRQARRPGEGRAGEAVDEAHDDDHQQHARHRGRQGHRPRVRRRDRDAELRGGAGLGRGRRHQA